MPRESVEADLDAGTAVLRVGDLETKDFFDLGNALLRNGPAPRPAKVSYLLRWTGHGPTKHFDNPDQRYRGSFRDATATMEWAARTPDFEFRSAPASTSRNEAAMLGFETNGSYYSSI